MLLELLKPESHPGAQLRRLLLAAVVLVLLGEDPVERVHLLLPQILQRVPLVQDVEEGPRSAS